MKNNVNKKITTSIIMCAFIVAIFFPLVQSQIGNLHPNTSRDTLNWWNAEWPYRKLITINNTKVIADLMNFPVMIYLPSDPNLADAAQPNGQDIVFVGYSDNSTTLNHEIESYKNINGNLAAWVNVTSLSSTADTKIWMYYGNTLCGNQQHIEGTWDPYFLAVHHLEETTGTIYDSTYNNNDGISYGNLNQDYIGKINGAYYFDGTDDHVTLPQVFSSQNQFTMEAWIYPQTGARFFISQWNNYQGSMLQVGATPNRVEFYNDAFGVGNYGITLDAWYHVVASYDGIKARVYVNGHAPVSRNCTPPTWPAEGLYIGDYSLGGKQFHGIIDEVRLSNIARSSAWITTEFNNQNDSSNFFAIEDEEQYPYILTISVDGQGTVTKNPNQPSYPYNSIVTLTAIPNTGWSFSHWSGDASGSSPVTTVTMNANKSVTAHFTRNIYTLSITVNPATGGSVGAVPTPPYHYGDIVTLTASANQGYTFDHWSGDLTGNQNPTPITIDRNKTVITTFILSNNTPPVAMNDSATVLENSTNTSINVLANDYDPDGDNLIITSVTKPLNGTSYHNAALVYYTPLTSYIGPDSFIYTISDGLGGTASATVYITVIPTNENNTPPYQPNLPVPDNGETNVSITTDLWWIGGDPDPGDSVTYDVYFGTTPNPAKLSSNQTSNTYNLTALTNETTYYWRIVSWDNHKAKTPGPLWNFTTQEQQHQESSINVTITRPRDHSFYLRNFRFPRLSQKTIVYGPIIITASATAVNTSVLHVDFYIDGKIKKTDDTAPYNYRWSQLISFKHIIMVKAYGTNGQIATDDITVFKWRLHPIILLGGAILLTSNH